MPVDTSHDQDQKDVRPTPDKPCLTVRRGARVTTLRGAGRVKDVLLSLSEFADGMHQLTPPQVVVELDEPWDGEMFITTFLHKCEWPGKGDVFMKACKRLWPDQVQEDPAVSLRPTDTPTERGRPMKISERLKLSTRIQRRAAEGDRSQMPSNHDAITLGVALKAFANELRNPAAMHTMLLNRVGMAWKVADLMDQKKIAPADAKATMRVIQALRGIDWKGEE